MENILVTKCKPFIAKAWKLCHECVSVILNALPQTGLLCHVYDISHHTIYYIPLNFKIKIAKEVSKRYFKMNKYKSPPINRPIAKLYWSNFLKIHFLLQNIMNDILPYYKFSDILLHLYNSFSVYCFSWLVNMGCGTKLSPNIFFWLSKCFSVTRKILTKKVCQKISLS